MQKMAVEFPEFRLISADVARAGMPEFIKKFPKQYYNTGIAEMATMDLAAGLALGCILTLLVLFVPVQPVQADSSALLKTLEALQGKENILFGLVAILVIALGLVSMSKQREAL